MADCSSIQKSLAWCQGRPELPGMKRRIYYISKYSIVQWPVLIHDDNGRLTSASYAGDFTLLADAKWKFIDVVADKSQLTSEAQGEYPSQTQLNKLTAVHPGVEDEASAAAAYLNNNDNVFLVEDMRGSFRVVGSDMWPTKTTVVQDIGQGPTGSANTTISVEATDECPAPFYAGKITTEDGIINPNGNPTQYAPVNNESGSNTGGGSTSTTVAKPTISGTTIFYDSTKVTISGPSGATIYYTVDGSVPSSSSTIYSSPFTLTKTTNVKAIAILNGRSSEVVSKQFTQDDNSGMDQN